MRRFASASIAALALAACQARPPAPPPGPPAEVAVTFLTDPTTGRTDGPFDPATGARVQTMVDGDGILRVVLDPGSFRPILLPVAGPDESAAGAPEASPQPAPPAPGAPLPLVPKPASR